MQVIISILGDRMRPMQCGLLILQLRFWCHCEERSDEAIYHDRLLRFARNDDDDVQKNENAVIGGPGGTNPPGTESKKMGKG